MGIVCNRLLFIFLSFLMLFPMPVFANESGNTLDATRKINPHYVVGQIAACSGMIGIIGSGIMLAVNGGKWEVPYCNETSEYFHLIDKDAYPSCPNCSVNFEDNCHNATNCYVNEKVCVNGDGSQTMMCAYKMNPGYIGLITFFGFIVIGLGFYGVGYFFS